MKLLFSGKIGDLMGLLVPCRCWRRGLFKGFISMMKMLWDAFAVCKGLLWSGRVRGRKSKACFGRCLTVNPTLCCLGEADLGSEG